MNLPEAIDKTIMTSQPESVDCAVNELRAAGVSARFTAAAPGVTLIDAPFGEVAGAFAGAPPLFARHICPAELSFPPDASPDEVAEGCGRFSDEARAAESFSVQTASYTGARAMEYTAAVTGSQAFSGISTVAERPESALSVVAAPTGIFAGFSRTAQNLAPWAGGMFRYADSPERVSRAEFKLLEVMELFSLSDYLPDGASRAATALDLGAAPGGWTRVLRSKGFRVTAVDPAELDPRVASDPGVEHYRGLSQDFIAKNPSARFDTLVNDMRMDASESARVTISALPALSPGGIVIMTLKLPQKGMQRAANRAVELLSESLSTIAARQLFHNRSEVTFVGCV